MASLRAANALHRDPRVTQRRRSLARDRSHADARRSHGVSRPSDTSRLLREHAQLVDTVVRGLWNEVAMSRGVALVAVGGYGRGQIFPHSDVDIMLLLPAGDAAPFTPAIERLLTGLWDAGLVLGHAVRTIDECEQEMANDATVRTSLLEHRLVAGNRKLFREFTTRFLDTLDVRGFYEAKALEQQHATSSTHAAYNSSPLRRARWLRDRQTVIWIARAAGLGRTGASSPRTGSSLREARGCRGRNASSARCACAFITLPVGARSLVSTCRPPRLPIGWRTPPGAPRATMQAYYRAAKGVRQVNTILLQNLHAQLFRSQASYAAGRRVRWPSTNFCTCATGAFERRPGRCSRLPAHPAPRELRA